MKKGVTVNLSNKVFYSLTLFVGILLLGGIVYAVSPSVHGHPESMPSGAVMAFNLDSCPDGWTPADGTSGTVDMRGAFARGINGDENGRDVARELGSYQEDEFKSHTHLVRSVLGSEGGNNAGGPAHSIVNRISDATGGAETRPKNIALLYCMRE